MLRSVNIIDELRRTHFITKNNVNNLYKKLLTVIPVSSK